MGCCGFHGNAWAQASDLCRSFINAPALGPLPRGSNPRSEHHTWNSCAGRARGGAWVEKGGLGRSHRPPKVNKTTSSRRWGVSRSSCLEEERPYRERGQHWECPGLRGPRQLVVRSERHAESQIRNPHKSERQPPS